MMLEEGWVVALDGGDAWVTGSRKSSCGGCHSKGSCAALSGSLGQREIRMRVKNSIGALVGERVALEFSESAFLKASFLVYVVPIVALLLVGGVSRAFFYSLGFSVDFAELAAAVSGLAALGMSFYLIGRFNRRLEKVDSLRPVMVRVLDQPLLCVENSKDGC
ncbi:MAG: SoxR reducing system RseC family protein [Magnetococcus sp. DMHC-6]